ncbi:hypothetical protein ACIQWL_49375 [Streptomyces mirabilis]|uniref:hypothetical protein n=1 Tax=Streptomyces mirabilis TaxID=68239 RepID=UPI00381EB162
MTKEETASYIKHHLTIAGRSDPLFSDDVVDLGRHLVADRDPLVQGCQDAVLHPFAQGGLADQQHCERRRGVHVVVGEHADRVQLVVVQEVAIRR